MEARASARRGEDPLRTAWVWSNWVAVPFAVGFMIVFASRPLGPRTDDLGYWLTRSGPLYDIPWNSSPVAYVYSPAFAQVIRPLTVLPFAAFHAVGVVAQTAALVWLVGPLLAVAYLASPLGALNVWAGNWNVLLAAAIALEVWPIVALTKVAPTVGAAWLIGRRAWRRVAVAMVATAAIVLVSAAVWPAAWGDWIGALLGASDVPSKGWPIPLWARLPVALIVALAGGWSGRRWTIAVAAWLGMPNFGPSALTILLAIPRLEGRRALGSIRPGRPRTPRPSLGGAERSIRRTLDLRARLGRSD